MKKLLLFLLLLLQVACSQNDKSPIIKVEKVRVDRGKGVEERNYSGCMDELPALKAGDKIDALLLLDGNGAELKTFMLQSDDEVNTVLHYKEREVSVTGELTDEEKGQLRFIDGVTHTTVSVQATIKKVDEEGDVKLFFYLSSKADCEGTKEVLGLKTKAEE
ncbi:hypothetical protein HMPREF1981_01880 [Bacteroides pyogenes F0041]|uniref:DUF5035 domain-containing protein n=1 Tax=Bacteroides pyogenes F0041 TaxID=1321819 RepID=U2CMN5_9BACE|nr:DUF5035 family protein [Bacteroides pyogenes]ERI85323.1 hypothetical protein HMPREF1981_01880 [Bacteroides pyogenes F0041]MBB3895505.1 hypothetical protein [Bacteroides pyogenes]GAE22775.1 hypothetical protein JCM10003_2426 [Bacteroides pyogenes JCM 10003]SUV32836.1 putative lipoprotein [Bacteroides pyogenes]